MYGLTGLSGGPNNPLVGMLGQAGAPPPPAKGIRGFMESNPAAWSAIAGGLLAGPSLRAGLQNIGKTMPEAAAADRTQAAMGEWARSPEAAVFSPGLRKIAATNPGFGALLAKAAADRALNPTEVKDPLTRIIYKNGLPIVHQYDRNTGEWKPLGDAKAPYGKRTTINPDGTVTLEEGTGVVPAGNQQLTRSTTSKNQQDIASVKIQQDQLERIGELYDEEVLTYQGQARGWWARQADKLGQAGPNDKKIIEKQQKFIQNVEDFFNVYRKDITGAAAALAELDRLQKATINTNQSPTQFKASLGEAARKIDRMLSVKLKMLDEGIDLSDPGFSAEFNRRFKQEGLDGPEDDGGSVDAPASVDGAAEAAEVEPGSVERPADITEEEWEELQEDQELWQ